MGKTKIDSNYSEELVQRLNELYHDLINEKYHFSHPEIFEQEKERWKRIAKQFLNFANPITIVDIGTGTGFVPLTITKFLKEGDIFICSDISGGILGVAKQNINRRGRRCQFKFVKIESHVPFQLPFETESMDIVTMNSVLHHIKDTNTFLSEVNRILKSNGLLFIAHEPNKYFYENKFLCYNYLFVDPKFTILRIFKKLHIEKIIVKVYCFIRPEIKENVSGHKKITNKINEVLLKENLIKKPLLPEEIGGITDVKVEGFKPDLLMPYYKLLHFETYNHLGSVIVENYDNFIIRKYDNLLRRKYPKEGATFFIVLKKVQNL